MNTNHPTPRDRYLGLFSLIVLLWSFTATIQAQPSTQEGFTCPSVAGATEIEQHGSTPDRAPITPWARLSKGIVHALTLDNNGVKQSALHMIIHYGPRLDVEDAVCDVMNIYRNHESNQLRTLAVTALGYMNSPWAMAELARALRSEKEPSVEQAIRAVLSSYFGPQHPSLAQRKSQ